MKKLLKAMTSMVVSFPLLMLAASAFALDVPTITAMARGPNQIILTWSAVAKPGWGYRVEIQSDRDTRYPSWTELSWQNGLSYLPYWVTDQGGTQKVYTDPTTASSGWGDNAQCNIYGLKYGTLYNFRVRTWGKTDAGVATYGSYSSLANATTTTPAAIRYVDAAARGSNNGTSWANAWTRIYSSMGVTAGTLVLIKGGNYASDYIDPNNSGTYGTGRIVFQANYGEIPIITSTGGGNGIPIHIRRNFIVLDGIQITSNTTVANEPPVTVTGNRNAFVNCKFQGQLTANAWGLVWIYPTGTYNLIHNCYLYDNGSTQGQGACVTNRGPNVNHNTVQYCYMSRGGHESAGNYGGSQYNRQLNNYATDCGEMTVATSDGGAPNSRYNLCEGNIIVNTGKNTQTDYKPGIQLSGSYCTVRRNIIYDGWASSTVGKGSAGIEVSDLHAVGGQGNLVHNNTVAHNGGAGFMIWGGRENIIKNNVDYDNAIGATEACNNMLHLLTDAAAGNDNVISKNLILDVTVGGAEKPGAAIISRAYGNCVAVAYANANYPDIKDNYDNYPPQFIDYVGRDFHLKSTSRIINLGDVVTDATWGTIGYLGAAPDIGAFEYDEISGGGDAAPAAPKGLVIK